MDCDEPHLTPNEKTQPIQWTEQPTGALAAAGLLWPSSFSFQWSSSFPSALLKLNGQLGFRPPVLQN
jgi:hypothetical protein